MQLQVGIKALLRNREGKYLLMRRSAKYGDIEGQWDIVGGRIEPGAPLIENLKREIQEETGLTLAEEPKLVAAQDILTDPKKHVVRLTYHASIEGEPRLDGEHTEYGWFNKVEVQNMKQLDKYLAEVFKNYLFE